MGPTNALLTNRSCLLIHPSPTSAQQLHCFVTIGCQTSLRFSPKVGTSLFWEVHALGNPLYSALPNLVPPKIRFLVSRSSGRRRLAPCGKTASKNRAACIQEFCGKPGEKQVGVSQNGRPRGARATSDAEDCASARRDIYSSAPHNVEHRLSQPDADRLRCL